MGNTQEKTSLIDPSKTEIQNIKSIGGLFEFQFLKDLDTKA